MFQRAPIACRNFSSAPGRSGNSKRYSSSCGEAARVPADHVAHVQLGHLVVGHVGDREAGGAQLLHHRILLRASVRERKADEDLRAVGARVAVVELGDAAPAEHLAEAQEAAGLLGDHHREQRLALAAEVGALGDVSQAVEVHVGAAVDRHQALAAPALARRRTASVPRPPARRPARRSSACPRTRPGSRRRSRRCRAARSRRPARGTARRSPRPRAAPPRRRRTCRRARASRAARPAASRTCWRRRAARRRSPSRAG